MAAGKSNGGNGRDIPDWFKAFLREYREDREATGQALRTLAESYQHLAVDMQEVKRSIHELRQEQARTNQELARTNQELARTRVQTATLFRRLIGEVKSLRPRR